MLFVALLVVTAAPPPALVVVHDGALHEAQVTAAHLQASGKVLATLRDAPLSASCARSTACAERPTGALVAVAVVGHAVHVDLLDKAGATIAAEVVDVADAALLDATLAPALDRIADASLRAPETSLPPADAGNAWMPWVLGTGAVCGGLCLLGAGAGVVYAMVVSAQAAGNAAGNACGDALTSACTAPFDALGSACNGLGDIGNSCSGVGDSCSSAGDGLGNACSGIGDIGACAVMPNAPLEPGDPPRVLSAPPGESTTSPMRY